MAKVSDFKFGTQLGFAKPIIKSHPEEKVGVALGYGSSAKFGGPFNISVMTEASEFKFGTKLGFDKSNYKITSKDKGGRGFRLGSFKNLGFSFNIYAMAENSEFGAQLWFAN